VAVDLEKLKEILTNKMSEFYGEKILSLEIARGELNMTVDPSIIADVCERLKNDSDFQFNYLAYLTAVDNSALGAEPRYTVVYNLASLTKTHRMRVKAGVPENSPEIDTVVGVWGGANWMEREAFDMFGIVFKGHPDLRRILMPEDWQGHPLRKDFPLGGTKSFYFKRHTNPRAGEPENLVPRIREQVSDV